MRVKKLRQNTKERMTKYTKKGTQLLTQNNTINEMQETTNKIKIGI